MRPVQDLLNRIRWDPGFARGRIEVGYYDRVQHRVVRVPLQRVGLHDTGRGTLELLDERGAAQNLPLHRVRDLYRNGHKIWHRRGPEHRVL